jgi:hypothetical protein
MAGKTQRKPLPLKEQSLFKELLSQYENRTLKRALKTADQILKKAPEHGGKPGLSSSTAVSLLPAWGIRDIMHEGIGTLAYEQEGRGPRVG